MITPNKYMNLELSVINTGGIILKSLSHCPIQKFDELENTVISIHGNSTNHGNSTKRIFVNALCFLYLLGKISYQSGTDSIKLIKS